MLGLLMELHVTNEVDACALDLHCEVCVHTLPVRMEEFISQTRFFVEEDEGAEVGLLVRVGAESKLVEVVVVDMVVWAGRRIGYGVCCGRHCFDRVSVVWGTV